MPARKAPMIAARWNFMERKARPRHSASTMASGDMGLLGLPSQPEPRRITRVPPQPMTATKPMAPSKVPTRLPTSTAPPPCSDETTPSSSMARMSSITAAPRMIRASRRCSTPSSCSTRAVMPAEGATKAAATNIERIQSKPEPCAHTAPQTKGTITPSTPTMKALAPTFFRSSSRVSRPTEKRSRMTPISASTSRGVAVAISETVPQPRAEGPTTQPAAISPTTAGNRRRCAISPPICAATKMMKSISRMPAESCMISFLIGAAEEGAASRGYPLCRGVGDLASPRVAQAAEDPARGEGDHAQHDHRPAEGPHIALRVMRAEEAAHQQRSQRDAKAHREVLRGRGHRRGHGGVAHVEIDIRQGVHRGVLQRHEGAIDVDEARDDPHRRLRCEQGERAQHDGHRDRVAQQQPAIAEVGEQSVDEGLDRDR